MFVSVYLFDKYLNAIGPRIITAFQLMWAVLPDIECVQYNAPFLNSKDFEHKLVVNR